jgi:hypothetical protein
VLSLRDALADISQQHLARESIRRTSTTKKGKQRLPFAHQREHD